MTQYIQMQKAMLWQLVDGCLKQIDGGERAVYGVNSQNDVYLVPSRPPARRRREGRLVTIVGPNTYPD